MEYLTEPLDPGKKIHFVITKELVSRYEISVLLKKREYAPNINVIKARKIRISEYWGKGGGAREILVQRKLCD